MLDEAQEALQIKGEDDRREDNGSDEEGETTLNTTEVSTLYFK